MLEERHEGCGQMIGKGSVGELEYKQSGVKGVQWGYKESIDKHLCWDWMGEKSTQFQESVTE